MKTIAEILKDCPKGMELYSPMFGCGELFKVTDKDIRVKFPSEHNVKRFRADGKISEDGECMLFPKKGGTWEGFVPPCQFKDGDILADKHGKDAKAMQRGLNVRINQIVLSLLFILSQVRRNVQRNLILGTLLLPLDLKDATRIDIK